MRNFELLLSIGTAGIFYATMINAQSPSGREIMERVEDYQRTTSDSAFNKMQLSTCRFGLKDNRITCAERPRVMSLESVSKNFGAEGKDTKTVTIVLEPAAERGIGMLAYAYDDVTQDNETWLYLSALGWVNALPAATRTMTRNQRLYLAQSSPRKTRTPSNWTSTQLRYWKKPPRQSGQYGKSRRYPTRSGHASHATRAR